MASAPDEPAADTGALYHFLHADKTVVSVGDAPLVAEKIAAADAIIVGPTTVDLVDEAVLHRHRRTDASVVTVSPFGAEGPLVGQPADEFTLQAWCGLMSGCGTPTTPPLQMGIGHGQWAAGTITALSVLAGSEYRARTGHGADFDVSALEVMAMCLTNYPPLYRQFTGSVSLMSRSGDWPSVVRCRDGWIGLRVHRAAVGRLRRHDRAATISRTTIGSTRWAVGPAIASWPNRSCGPGSSNTPRPRSTSSADCSGCRSRSSATDGRFSR